MKFCSECGSILNGETKCSMCGFDLETGEFSKEKQKEREEQEKILANQPSPEEYEKMVSKLYPNDTYQAPEYMFDIKKKMEELLEKSINKEIPLDTLKSLKMEYDELIGIMFAEGIIGLNESNIYSLDFEQKELKHIKTAPANKHKTTKIYKVEEKIIEKLKEIIINNNIAVWSKLEVDYAKEEDINNHTDFYIDMKKIHYPIPSKTILTTEEQEIFKNIKELIKKELKENNIISTEELTEEQIRYKQVPMG